MKALSEIQTLEGGYSFDGSGFIAKFSCFIVSEMVCVRKPRVSQTIPVSNTYDSYDSFFTTTTDGINWSSWERLPNWGM
jgi:hypothetical protein